VHIELAELLRCPEPHEEQFCVVSPDLMDGRTVIAGLIGCPSCRNEYSIRDGVCTFVAEGTTFEPLASNEDVGTDAPTACALLNLSGPGGNVALVGSAALLAHALADVVAGVHFVACNAPPSVGCTDRVSVLIAPKSLPLRTSSMRGVVLGSEMFGDPWIQECIRVQLRGTRFVSIGQTTCPEGIRQLAVGGGMLVGEKT
jgi:uncharacterized protein YbaR (Trm112 family)